MLKVNRKNVTQTGRLAAKNQGGVLGGLGYAGASIAAGLGGLGEGIVDLFGAAGNLLVGDVEGAKDMFRNNVVGDWYADITEDYNPGTAMSFVGDVLYGVSNSSVLLLNAIPGVGQVATAAYFTSAGSQGISSAAEKTGDVGFKEIAYGTTMGAVEGGLEAAFGGAAKVGKSIGKAVAKGTIKSTAKTAVRKGLTKKILSNAASEFAEEFATEYIDTTVQRWYKIDPEKQYSLKDATYAGIVGMVSGATITSAVEVPKTISNRRRGESIIERGNSQTLVNTANYVADKLAAPGTNFEKAAEWVRTLRGEVDAYNALVKKGKGGSASAATILGEMQASLYYAEMQSAVSGVQQNIASSSEQARAALAEYATRTIGNGKIYTAEDIANNTDNITSDLAIMHFAGAAFNYDGDMAQESAIGDVIAEESGDEASQMQSAEGGEQSKVKYSLGETTDGRSIAVVDDDILSGIYTGTWDKATVEKAKKAAKTALLKFKDGITVKGITAKVNKTSRDEYARSDYSEALRKHDPKSYADKMRAASVADDVVVAATNWNRDGGLTHPRKDDFVDFDRGQTLIASGKNKYSATVILGITSKGEYVFYDVEDISDSSLLDYRYLDSEK